MNTTDYDKEVRALASKLNRAASGYGLALILARQTLKPCLLNGDNPERMQARGAVVLAAAREAETATETARTDKRRKGLYARASRYFRTDADGGTVYG